MLQNQKLSHRSDNSDNKQPLLISYSNQNLSIDQKASDLLEFINLKPDNEMCQVIQLCIYKANEKLKTQLVLEYEETISQINRAQRDLTKRILDELTKIKLENEQQTEFYKDKLLTQKAKFVSEIENHYLKKLQEVKCNNCEILKRSNFMLELKLNDKENVSFTANSPVIGNFGKG